MRISVLLPSRGRPNDLEEAVDSLYSNARNRDDVEVLVRLDSDDPTLREYLASPLKDVTSYFVNERGRGYPDMHLYVNQLSAFARGEWLFLFNDDARMRSPEWDRLILGAEWPEICVLRPNQTDAGNLFPIVSRKFYETLGHFSLSPHNDSWVESISRYLDIEYAVPGLWVDHLRDSYTDQTHTESQAAYATTSPEFHAPAMQTLLMQDIEKIRKAIG